jgi:hypothetical protein
MHECPNNIIGFEYGQDIKYPVQQVHSKEMAQMHYFGFEYSKNNFNGGYDRKQNENFPDSAGIRNILV